MEEGREMILDDLDMLNLRYPVEYPGAKGLEYYRECEPVAYGQKKIRMGVTYLGFISKEIGKGIIEGEMV